MFGITDIVTYIVAVVVVIVLPGPNSLYCLSTAVAHGRRAGFLAATGVVVGDTLLIIATVLGAGVVLKLYPTAFHLIKLVGGAYLFYLGAKLFLGAYATFVSRHRLTSVAKIDLPVTPKHNYFYRALMLSLTNPKAILFLLSFFVPFVDPNYPKPFLSFFILALILQAVSSSYLLSLVFVGRHLANKFAQKPWPSIAGMSLVGVLFIGFAVNLWTSQL